MHSLQIYTYVRTIVLGMDSEVKPVSKYLDYLPAIFETPLEFADERLGSQWLGRFLLAFELILSGNPGKSGLEDCRSEQHLEQNVSDVPLPSQGLEEIIANIAKLFRPSKQHQLFHYSRGMRSDESKQIGTDAEIHDEFLQWLAGWAALTLRSDWPRERQQTLLAQIIPLYKRRGTKDNLIKLLKIYAGNDSYPKVIEPEDRPFQIGVDYLQVGVNTVIPFRASKGLQLGDQSRLLGGATPYSFKVEITVPRGHNSETELEGELLKKQYEVVSALVNLEKPAHTNYQLAINVETVLVGERLRCTISKNMLIGNIKRFSRNVASSSYSENRHV